MTSIDSDITTEARFSQLNGLNCLKVRLHVSRTATDTYRQTAAIEGAARKSGTTECKPDPEDKNKVQAINMIAVPVIRYHLLLWPGYYTNWVSPQIQHPERLYIKRNEEGKGLASIRTTMQDETS